MASLNFKPPVLIDNGTGYTKMGYAGSAAPSYVIPTLIGTPLAGKGVAPSSAKYSASERLDDLDVYIGNEAQSRQSNYGLSSPIKNGLIKNWDQMEKLWERCVFKFLKCEPEEHYFLLTEPPMNLPENREYTAEVMFETFNVPGLYIAVQAILALVSTLATNNIEVELPVLTGTVVESGDGVTHAIPVVDGSVIGSSIRSIPLAGRDITAFVQKMLVDRKEPIPPEDTFQVAKTIKEKFCYTSTTSIVEEYEYYDIHPNSRFRTFSGVNSKTKQVWKADIGYERFLGPEIFFKPEIFDAELSQPLDEVVDQSILACPIDTRRDLYSNIVLSGGSTMFRGFGTRLQESIQARVQDRSDTNVASHGIPPELAAAAAAALALEVNVVAPAMRHFAVFAGGAKLSATPRFANMCFTKAKYEEEGARIARHSPVVNRHL